MSHVRLGIEQGIPLLLLLLLGLLFNFFLFSHQNLISSHWNSHIGTMQHSQGITTFWRWGKKWLLQSPDNFLANIFSLFPTPTHQAIHQD